MEDEDLVVALQVAIREKKARIKRKEYLEELNKPVQLPPQTFSWIKSHFEERFKQNEGTGFVWDQHNEDQVHNILQHFVSDDKFGLFLRGPIGCGKSSVLKALTLNPFRPFHFVSCKKIQSYFAQGGFEVIQKYMKGNYCFDEFGDEEEATNYGNKVEVMTYILESQYDCKTYPGTMITTNLNSDQIRERYGERIWSRLNEMYDFVLFDTDSPDRRIK